MAIIMSGKVMSAALMEEQKEQVADMKLRGIHPGLAVVLVGEDPASQIYVRNNGQACEDAGIYSRTIRLDAAVSQESLMSTID